MALSPKPSAARDSLAALPSFDLTCRYDDLDDPAELTVFPADEDEARTTAWLTVEVGHAVALESVR